MKNDIFTFKREKGKLKVFINRELLLPEHQEQMKSIDFIYEIKYFIGMHNNKKSLIPKNKRICRFCGKSYPEVSFKKIAHIIPEFLGNRNLVSDYECDSCNWKFGQLENDLANYLGPFRTFALIEGKRGVPKYKSADNALKIELAKDDIVDVRYQDLQKNLNFIVEDNTLRIQCKSNPYVPINVFRSLLKSALSFIDKHDLKYLTKTFKFLNDDAFEINENESFLLTFHQYFIPGSINTSPFIIYFKKRETLKDLEAPSMAFVFYIKNIVIQLFIPFHSDDLFFYDSNMEEDRKLLIIPPMVTEEWIKQNGQPFSRIENCNNKDKLDDIIQNIWFKLG
jgi:hypothetical protein